MAPPPGAQQQRGSSAAASPTGARRSSKPPSPAPGTNVGLGVRLGGKSEKDLAEEDALAVVKCLENKKLPRKNAGKRLRGLGVAMEKRLKKRISKGKEPTEKSSKTFRMLWNYCCAYLPDLLAPKEGLLPRTIIEELLALMGRFRDHEDAWLTPSLDNMQQLQAFIDRAGERKWKKQALELALWWRQRRGGGSESPLVGHARKTIPRITGSESAVPFSPLAVVTCNARSMEGSSFELVHILATP